MICISGSGGCLVFDTARACGTMRMSRNHVRLDIASKCCEMVAEGFVVVSLRSLSSGLCPSKVRDQHLRFPSAEVFEPDFPGVMISTWSRFAISRDLFACDDRCSRSQGGRIWSSASG